MLVCELSRGLPLAYRFEEVSELGRRLYIHIGQGHQTDPFRQLVLASVTPPIVAQVFCVPLVPCNSPFVKEQLKSARTPVMPGETTS